MIEVEGRYNSARIFTDDADEAALEQVKTLLNQEFVAGSRICMMPDIHAGAGCTIGTTMTIKDKIVPNLVGVDIGCGVFAMKVRETEIDPQKLDSVVRERVPAGFNIRKTPSPLSSRYLLEQLSCRNHVDIDRALRSVGTLGGGNHFIEADRDERGYIWLVVHSGSRHLGVEIATYYQNEAYKMLKAKHVSDTDELIAELKAEGRQREIPEAIKKQKAKQRSGIPKELAYVEGPLYDSYLSDMEIAQDFAMHNRHAIIHEIADGMGLTPIEMVESVHNYINLDNMILRKGAVSAKEGERLIIPINMRDGSLLCYGKGNPYWNYSAPHGAGRLMSRARAKTRLTVDDFKKEMQGIYTTSVGADTLDESPMAYKSIESIMENIKPTVTVEQIIKPIYSFKAGGR